ncbi:MAG: MMPL family transporter [Actinobacteria bacterium]|nr:MMPL family transporter [Actinomycetota bacterium]
MRRPLPMIVAVGLLALIAAFAALQLQPDTGVESITGNDSKTYAATQQWAERFGGDPIVILVRGDLAAMVLGPDLGRMLGLEGCISGKIPNSARTRPDVPQICKRFGDFKPAVAVYGPGTFVSTAARTVTQGIKRMLARAEAEGERAAAAAAEIARREGKPPLTQQQVAEAARELAKFRAARDALQMGQEYGLSVGSLPSVDNPAFVAQLVFDPSRGSKTPKSRFQYIFPNTRSAVIQIRLRPDLTPGQRAEAVDLVKRAVAQDRYQLDHGNFTVTGAPVVMTGAQDAIETAVVTLLIGALIVMALVLFFVFPAEMRLLPLVLALMAAAFTYGLLALTGSNIGVGAVAVLPVLIGLAVDYAIQFHARADRAMANGAEPAAAVRHAAGSGGPPVLTAAFATVAALVAMGLSPVPLVRGFGLLLVAGVCIAVVVVMTSGFAVLGWAGGATRGRPRREPAERVAGWIRLRRAFGAVIARPGRVLAVACVLAAFGWGAALFSPVGTEVRQLVPDGSSAGKDLAALQKATGTAGEVDVFVKSADVTDPEVIGWMRSYQSDVLARAGYKGKHPTCEKSDLCPAASLASLFENQQQLSTSGIRKLLRSVGDFSKGLVSKDRRTATMAFGVRLNSLSDQKRVIDMMREQLHPPKGTTAEIVGLTALAADAGGALSNPLRRALIAGVALLLFLLIVIAVTRSARRAAPPALTVALAAGVSSLLLFVARVDLNPMSAALAVFVIAIAGEFTLLIYMQYLSERRRDDSLGVEAAFRRAYRAIGPAVFASGVTAISGFAVLALADIRMLRGFALVAVVDLAVALVGAVLLLPAATLWFERDRGGGRFGRDRAPVGGTPPSEPDRDIGIDDDVESAESAASR